MKHIACAIAAVALSLISLPAAAKSETIKIEVIGSELNQPIEIVDAPTLRRFSIWTSPGIDWKAGAVPAPRQVKSYTIVFHQGGREPMHDWHRRYVVTYAIDADTRRGYIHLPGKDAGDVYNRNVFSIYRGVEGQWFNATPEWESLVRPTIESGGGRRAD
jgi:hypothetical protein